MRRVQDLEQWMVQEQARGEIRLLPLENQGRSLPVQCQERRPVQALKPQPRTLAMARPCFTFIRHM